MKLSRSFFEFNRFAYKLRGRGALDTPFHSHSQYEILYIDDASCEYTLGDRVIPLQAGDLFIMNGLTRHFPSKATQETYVRTALIFEPHLLQQYYPSLCAFDPLIPFKQLRNFHIRLSGEKKLECEAILRKIHLFYKKGDPVYDNRFLLAFFDLLIFIQDQCRTAMNNREEVLTGKEQHVQKVIDFIETCYTEDISLEHIESQVHMSKYHLAKIFHATTGKTIFDYILYRRINQAKLLFHLSRDSTVTGVCHQVGFKHLAHFSRTFKKIVGMTPGQYRKYYNTQT